MKNKDRFENDVFEDFDMTEQVKSAKRKTILRNIIVSSIVFIILIGTLSFTNYKILNSKGHQLYRSIQQFEEITGPNIQMKGVQYDYNFLSGKMKLKNYKIVGERAIPWEESVREYKLWGGLSRMVGSYGPIQLIKEEQDRFFNYENGEMEMLFFHPYMSYANQVNDFSILDKVSDNQLIEMALSFDQGYSLEETEGMFSDNIQPSWYWVNTLDKGEETKDSRPSHASRVYGFDAYKDPFSEFAGEKNDEDEFISILEHGIETNKVPYYKLEMERVYKNVKANRKDGMIIGVVVSGTKEELHRLKDKDFIKSATLGATIDQY